MKKIMILKSKDGSISKAIYILLFILILLVVPPKVVGGSERIRIYDLSRDDDVSYQDSFHKKLSPEKDSSL